MKKLVLGILFLVSISSNSLAKDTENSIDKILNDCFKKNSITQAQIECVDKAKVIWQKELDKYYKLLLKRCSKETALVLTKSQNNWLIFKKTELKLINELYKNRHGSMFLSMQEYEEVKLIRSRALVLKDYYDKDIEFSD